MRNIDISTLPPYSKRSIQHIRRVNYTISIWKNSHIAQPNITVPSERHGRTRVNGAVEPLRLTPQRLDCVLQDTIDTVSVEKGEEEDSDVEVEYIID